VTHEDHDGFLMMGKENLHIWSRAILLGFIRLSFSVGQWCFFAKQD
jgi:hypothetical protein